MREVVDHWGGGGNSLKGCPLLLPARSPNDLQVISSEWIRFGNFDVSVGNPRTDEQSLRVSIVPPDSTEIADGYRRKDPVEFADGTKLFDPGWEGAYDRILLIPGVRCGYSLSAENMVAISELWGLRRVSSG